MDDETGRKARGRKLLRQIRDEGHARAYLRMAALKRLRATIKAELVP